MDLVFEHFRIRDYALPDAAQLYGLLGDPGLMRFMEKVYTYEETVHFLSECLNRNPVPVYALEDLYTGNLCGHIIFHPYDRNSYEIGWIIASDYQGNRLAEKASHALIAFGIQHGIRTYVIECAENNKQSAYIAEKAGFHQTGCEGQLRVYRKYT